VYIRYKKILVLQCSGVVGRKLPITLCHIPQSSKLRSHLCGAQRNKGLFKNDRTHLYSPERSGARCNNVMAFCWGNFWAQCLGPSAKLGCHISRCVVYCRPIILAHMKSGNACMSNTLKTQGLLIMIYIQNIVNLIASLFQQCNLFSSHSEFVYIVFFK